MIVKKIPILQGFPDYRTVKTLSKKRVETESFSPVFYDIETTGLSRSSTFTYLIGAIGYENGAWMLHQWMAETEKEEMSVLRAFSTYMEGCSCTISYNGDSFDKPYVEERCKRYDLPSPFIGKESLDLYVCLKPLKKLLKLPAMKQPNLEEFLGIGNRVYCDGRECIQLYKNFLKKRDLSAADVVIGHNLEDVLGLGKILLMLGYLKLYEGEYEVCEMLEEDEHLLITLTLPCALPERFSNGNELFYITGENDCVKLIIKAQNGRYRQYYRNYKDYDYLPAEDTAIPKALSSCIDRKLRKSATKATCYTWFRCTEAFLANPDAQKKHLEYTLTYLLGTLS